MLYDRAVELICIMCGYITKAAGGHMELTVLVANRIINISFKAQVCKRWYLSLPPHTPHTHTPPTLPAAAELYMLIPSHGSLASRALTAGSELRASQHTQQRTRVTGPEVSGLSPVLTMETASSVYRFDLSFHLFSAHNTPEVTL